MRDVTLSFDNGPEPEVTPFVLDVLRRRGLRATFFIIGRKLADPAIRRLAEQAHAEGHWIGNHSWTHDTPLGLRRDPGHAEAEIGRTQGALGSLAHPAKLFRPVGGGGVLGAHLLSVESRRFLEAGGYTVVTWNVVPGDWHDADGWPARALAACLSEERPVLVLHDLPGGAMRHLDRFLGRLADAGATFRQDFPDAVLLMRGGIAMPGLSEHVAVEDHAACPA